MPARASPRVPRRVSPRCRPGIHGQPPLPRSHARVSAARWPPDPRGHGPLAPATRAGPRHTTCGWPARGCGGGPQRSSPSATTRDTSRDGWDGRGGRSASRYIAAGTSDRTPSLPRSAMPAGRASRAPRWSHGLCACLALSALRDVRCRLTSTRQCCPFPRGCVLGSVIRSRPRPARGSSHCCRARRARGQRGRSKRRRTCGPTASSRRYRTLRWGGPPWRHPMRGAGRRRRLPRRRCGTGSTRGSASS